MKFIQLAVISVVICGCYSNTTGQYKYRPPAPLSDQLIVGSLADVQIDSIPVIRAINRIKRGKYGEIHSLLLYKDGKLVLDEYFPGHDYDWQARKHHGKMIDWSAVETHSSHSVSKSITSLCIGIAIDQGMIRDVHQSIFDYLPDYQYLNNNNRNYITIEHLLTCTSGLQWAEWNAPLSSMDNDMIAIWFHEKGPVDFYLQRPLVAVPGTFFTYSGGGIDLLAVILEKASGMSFDAFTQKYLFQPMGIETASWELHYNTGETGASSGLRIRPRDLVKIGAMMLNGGTWNGTRIISEEWVKKSRVSYPPNQHIDIPGEDLGTMGYAYTWWTKKETINHVPMNWFSANGWGGQKIVILPEVNSVIVFTGANYTSKVKEYRILENYIFPAFH